MSVKRYLSSEFRLTMKIDPDSNEVTKILSEDQDRTVLFENVNGGKAAGNIFSTRDKIANAMNVGEKELLNHMLNSISRPEKAPVTDKPEFRSRGHHVDLMSLPIPRYFPHPTVHHLKRSRGHSMPTAKRRL